jgi:integrase
VDLKAGHLQIVHTRVVADGKVVESEPKTDAGKRSIPLDPKLVAILKAHKARQAQEELVDGTGLYEDSGYLFNDELGRAYYPDTLSEWFDDQIKASGLPRIRLHDCRHTAATLMLRQGTPVHVVSQILGHASIRITLDFYGHVLPGQTEEAGAKLSSELLP